MTQAFSNENLRKCIVAWMVSTDTPFSAVEHVTFKRLVLCAELPFDRGPAIDDLDLDL